MKITSIEEALSVATQHHRSGRLGKAEQLYLQILEHDPGNPDALRLLGTLEYQTARHAAAAEHLNQSLRLGTSISPKLRAACLGLLGEIHRGEGKLLEAVNAYRAALAMVPDDPSMMTDLGGVLKLLGRTDEALDCYHQALLIDPNLAAAHNNLGNLLRERRKLEAAIVSYRTALAKNPKLADTCLNLGLALKEQGRITEAIDAFRRGLAQDHQHPALNAALYLALLQACAWSEAAEQAGVLDRMLFSDIQRGAPVREAPSLNLIRSADPAQNLIVARSHSEAVARRVAQLSLPVRPMPASVQSRKIRLGYLFNDHHRHAIKRLVLRLLGLHDRERFEIMLYPCGQSDQGLLRSRMLSRSDRVCDIGQMTLVEAATAIAADAPDILIDVTGCLPGHRLDLLALRLAPVQAVYCGWPATTGAPFVDFILADQIVLPPGEQLYYSERPIYLPHFFLPDSGNMDSVMPPASDRAAMGLPREDIIFSAFLPEEQIEQTLFESWMRILTHVPRSVLWLARANPAARSNLCREAALRKVDPKRLVFAKRVAAKSDHVARIGLADLALDSETVSSPVATMDALKAGVPVLTILGNRYISRTSSSIVSALGLPELATTDLPSYEAMAIDLATSPDRLAALKMRLRRGNAAIWNPDYEQVWMRRLEDNLGAMVMSAGATRPIMVQ